MVGKRKKKEKGRIAQVRAEQGRASSSQRLQSSKKQRRLHAVQVRNKKKAQALRERRIGSSGPPRIVGIIPFGDIDARQLKCALANSVGVEVSLDHNGPLTIRCEKWKERVSIVASPRSIEHVLETARISDLLVFVVPLESGIDDISYEFASVIRAQGVPSVVGVVVGENHSVNSGKAAEKLKQQTKQQYKAIFDQLKVEFYEDMKGVYCEKSEEDSLLFGYDKSNLDMLFRWIHTSRPRSVHWRDIHPYLLVDSFAHSGTDTLCVSGYLRGRNLAANQLVHITGVGTFQLLQVDYAPDPCPISKRAQMENDGIVVADTPDENQEKLVAENVPDPLDAEQTWPTEEEMREAEVENAEEKKKKRLMKNGMSEYQAHWLIREEEGEWSSDEEEEDDNVDVEHDDAEKMGMEDNAFSDDESEHLGDDNVDNDEMDLDVEAQEKQRRKEERMDINFPDEVDTPIDQSGKVRFGKYRGLRSFRFAEWDSYENLPTDYSRIFTFESFRRTRKRVLADAGKTAMVNEGEYVKLHITGVSPSVCEGFDFHRPMIVSALLPHEYKMSVLHFKIQRTASLDDSEILKSKDEFIFQCGFRGFVVHPLFSHSDERAKNRGKYEKFFRPQQFVMATVYMPVCYTPMSVLVFRRNGTSMQFVALGSLAKVDPEHLLLKRIALSGYPVRCNKRAAVVRFMFFNPDDVRWFQPVELHTKMGLHGQIRESVGTHGRMKCRFDNVISAQDTVLMNLYKRVFPKWNTVEYSVLP